MLAAAPRAVVLIWPRLAQLDPRHSEWIRIERYPDYQEALARSGRAAGAQVIDVGQVFRDSGRPFPALFLDDVHASPEGCRLVARAVAVALRR
jgi:lysophospholipase L1-like esterase